MSSEKCSYIAKKTFPVEKKAKPFLKWAGGKQQLLSQFEKYFPSNFNRYLEPFVGGGAVFFHLWNTDRLPEHKFLFDNNEELVNAYCIVRDKLDELISRLTTHQKNHSKEYFYQIRSLDRQDIKLSDVERAARTIYLNRTCYNGLYRVNRNKQFNVPIGSYKNPQILCENVLEAASLALQNVSIKVMGFREVTALAQTGDFFYFDPPYDPVGETASFTGYTADSFQQTDQQDLAKVFEELTAKGCSCMLSNSYTPLILELYRNFEVKVVTARRAVNSDANGRGNIREIVVLNYYTR
jgi:DNA adenine methylase